MTDSQRKYITTPIYYVNDVPHIGHSYTTIIADILARYYRLVGKETFFLTGTDEHGQKIEKTAEEKNISPQELVDSVVERFKELWVRLKISNDNFIRTTDEAHKEIVKKFFKHVYDNGYIYLGEYEGLYCRPCESYYTETQVENNMCPECNRELTLLKEEAFFFKMSEFQEKLLQYIEENPKFVLPVSRRNEVLSFIKQGLNDLCISRTSISWGIEVPDLGIEVKKTHYVYVWFDALLNYISGIGYLKDDEKFDKWWPAYVHLIGKDILKFHAVIWPSMLMAAELPLPEHVFGHGFIYQGGEKMSKSKGNVLDPDTIIEEFGVDAFRYYLTREIVLGLDGTYSYESMRQRYNSDLANDFGNLLNRTLNMIKKYFNLEIGLFDESILSEDEMQLKVEAIRLEEKIQKNMDEFKLSIVLEDIFSVIRRANKYIEEIKPWILYKEGETKKLMTVMVQLIEAIRITSTWLMPFMPDAILKVYDQLNIKNDTGKDLYKWGYFKDGMKLNAPEPIFPRKQ